MRLDRESVLPVSILVEGPIDPKNISLVQTDQKIIYPADAEEFIEAAWQERGRRYPNRPLNNSPIIFLRGINEIVGGYEIVAGITDYRHRVGTTTPGFISQFGEDLVAKNIGVDALILTADQHLLIGQRNTPRPGKDGGLHITGGMVDPGENLLSTLEREIREEVNLEEDEWEVASLIGVTQSRETLAADVIFLCNSKLPSTKIAERKADGELGRRLFPNTSENIRYVLLQYLRTASTSVIAALYLYGNQTFGVEWANSVLEGVDRRNSVYNQLSPLQREVHMNKLARRIREFRAFQ